MSDTINNPDLVSIVERVDEMVSEAFQLSNIGGIAEDPKLRHRLFVILLRGFGRHTPGFNSSQVHLDLKRDLGQEARNKIEDIATILGEWLPKVVESTYTTTSYWSPIDERRHTVIHKSSDEDTRKTLAYAYAFFALTFAGAANNLYSVIQYISVKARHQRGPRVSFKEEPPSNENGNWWHIPRSVHKSLLEDTGINQEIQKVVLRDGQTPESELRRLLKLMLVNASDDKLEDIHSFAAQFIKTVSERYRCLSVEAREVVENTRLYLSKLFGSEPELNSEQAFFMLVTHLIYKEACPTDYIYTFPTRVATTCCVITVGTRDILDESYHLGLSRIATSLFTPPLLLDYAAQEAVARERYAAGVIHRINGPLGHLHNHFLENLVKACESEKSGLGTEVEKILQKGLRDSFEANLKKIHGSVRFLEGFIGATKPSEFEIVSVLDRLVAAQKVIHKQLAVDFNTEVSEAWVWGWQSELEFCVEEMFYNSARILAWKKREAPRVRVEIRTVEAEKEVEFLCTKAHDKIELPAVKIVISDNGPGISQSNKEKVFESSFKGMDSGSTGKGLYLIRHFIHERFRGFVYEDGIPGAGAAFTIILPVKRFKG